MKAKKILILLLTAAFSLIGCREITVKTRVNTDGSFTRIITVRGDVTDSAHVVKKNLPYPVDNSWEYKVQRDSADSTKLVCTYTKHFSNDRTLNESIRSDTSWKRNLEREIDISKRFMFFYSFVTYKETIRAADPSKLLNYRDYLSPQDMEWLKGYRIPVTEKDSVLQDSAEKRAEQYILHSFSKEIRLALEKGLMSLDDADARSLDLTAYMDSISKYAESLSGDQLSNLIDSLASWSGEKGVLELHDIEPPVFEEVAQKIDFFEHVFMMEDFRNEVEMPGVITATTSTQVVGNTVGWSVQSIAYYFEDLVMMVESRVVNQWAFIVSGVILLLLLVVFVIRMFR